MFKQNYWFGNVADWSAPVGGLYETVYSIFIVLFA